MPVLDKILEKLDQENIPYKKVEHDPVYTSEQAAQIRGSDLSKGAKALVCYADKQSVLLVVPGNMKADFKSYKRVFSIKDIRMATPEEVQNLTGLTIGSIPPFGSLMGLKSYFADQFSSKNEIVFNAGSHSVSIFMTAEDLIKAENPVMGDFAAEK
jgi:Ala-tRNA(Pro) deacylase